MSRKGKPYILQVDKENEIQELEFELDFQSTLSIQERFQMMFQMSNIIKRILIQNGHRKPVEIIQRH